MNSQFKLLFLSLSISSIFVSSFFLLDPGSSFHLGKKHYMSDILFIFILYTCILFQISVIMFAPPYNVYCSTISSCIKCILEYILLCNDDQSEPLCICLATMVLFYLTDL